VSKCVHGQKNVGTSQRQKSTVRRADIQQGMIEPLRLGKCALFIFLR
jgi:hypothetical protein